MRRPRLSDIAREAGVGVATVERVLNGRGNVAPATVERVVRAAKALGYQRPLPERHRGTIRIEAILMRPDTPFYARLNQALVRVSAALDKSIVVHRTFLDENDPEGVARHIARPGSRRSGLIIVAPDHPAVRAELRAARSAGLAVAHVVSRIGEPGEFPFIGIDNYAAGRTAAFYMTHMLAARRGRFVVLCHSGFYDAHRERVRGFSDYLIEHPDPGRLFALVLFGMDRRELSAALLEDAFERLPDIIGVYNAGGANSAVAAVLQRRGRGKRVMWIGHELTDNTRRFLKEGLMDIVLDQAPEIQARRALDIVLCEIGVIDVEISREPVRFLTVCAENL